MATEALASRLEPYSSLGYCVLGLGVSLLGVRSIARGGRSRPA